MAPTHPISLPEGLTISAAGGVAGLEASPNDVDKYPYMGA
jgi:hypothetical protein